MVYKDCPTNKRLQFACGDTTGAKYTSPIFPSMNLLSGTCSDFVGGANYPNGNDYILSIDSSNPTCGQYDVKHDIYMNFGNRWGCKGTPDTDEKSGWWFSVSYIDGKQYYYKNVIFQWI